MSIYDELEFLLSVAIPTNRHFHPCDYCNHIPLRIIHFYDEFICQDCAEFILEQDFPAANDDDENINMIDDQLSAADTVPSSPSSQENDPL